MDEKDRPFEENWESGVDRIEVCKEQKEKMGGREDERRELSRNEDGLNGDESNEAGCT